MITPLISDDQNDGNSGYSVHNVLAALQYSDGEYILEVLIKFPKPLGRNDQWRNIDC